ncbi:cytochrome b5 domain-containing protein 1 [Microplitis mediator]|uniref:cytochrome b5 domain-containing protein 1 n=1 Tax=Microplitis mediator TaxID=375433 RepID=UPI002555AC0C|nr:cytochrome b5 domain-containing protein 1 [Microplitis mediator]XP_057335652.1 cytochrome b5 domain-containing protein 1 [Microplitis mediator]
MERDEKNLEYFLPSEVVVHNKPEDCWVSYLGRVYNLTDLCKSWKDRPEIKPILLFAGKDISHWFDDSTGDIRHHVDPRTGALVPYCPHGPIPDVGIPEPSSTWRPLDRLPWWLDTKYLIGKLTKNPRPCRIINMLTTKEATIWVCEEETVRKIQERFAFFNSNYADYLWKSDDKILDLDKTLTENGIPDERELFVNCGLPDDFYIPSILCYYKDSVK